jgi:hypothetical protein
MQYQYRRYGRKKNVPDKTLMVIDASLFKVKGLKII